MQLPNLSSLMVLMTLAMWPGSCTSVGRASRLNLRQTRQNAALSSNHEMISNRSKTSDVYTLAQFQGTLCSGKFVALELTLDMMTQLSLPTGRSPEVLCNKLESADGAFVVHSCPGTTASGCPLTCESCHEDMVKHFTLGQCAGGWMLTQGDACSDNENCISKNQVDVGLARWCNKWPTPGVNTYEKKTSEDLSTDSATSD
mmetsp:Transcript_1492/g.2019  ORF Transcript_1492/g.2019 Transcript_1492/m.2019 type:complete len:201 (-) Transcript_1492:136-738(-)